MQLDESWRRQWQRQWGEDCQGALGHGSLWVGPVIKFIDQETSRALVAHALGPELEMELRKEKDPHISGSQES